MQPVYVLFIIMLYAAFGCVFLFVSWQHRGKFSRLLAQSWLLEAFRAGIVLMELDHPGGAVSHWHSLSDCLNLLATWWLLAGCAELSGVKLPARLGVGYVGIGVPFVLVCRYLAPGWLEAAGFSPAQADRGSVLIELSVLFASVAIARLIALVWLVRLWRETRLPGALLAILFAVPYMAFAIAVPVQFYFGYYPEWIYLTWVIRVLGFSLGMVLLLFDRHLSALRASEARIRRFIDSNIQGVLICDFSGRISSANDAFLRIVGYSRADLEAGRVNWQRLTPPEWVALDEWAVGELKARGVCEPWQKEYIRKDGSRVPVLVGVAVLDPQPGRGRAVECAAFVLDQTAARQTEERARHLANFPELNPNPVLEFTAEGVLAYENPAAQAMVVKMGRERLEQLLPEGTPAIVQETLASGQPRLRLVTTHGKTTLSWSFYPIVSQRVVHCYIGDITDRTHLEEQLRQAQKMEAIGQLAGGVAHDFNNLLTAILGHLGLLQSGRKLPPDVAESLAEITRAANRAANLTGQLLAFSRLQVINIRPLDLNEVVTHLARMLRRLLGEHITMQLELAHDHLHFNGDAGMIEQVVLNLAVNARDAMPQGGTLRIVTAVEQRIGRPAAAGRDDIRPGPFVCLTISDTGTGIAPDVLPKIFEPFFTTKEVGKGTGLGLATAFGIIQQHQGWIEVESEPGRGSCFRVFLPRLAAPAPPAEPGIPAPAAPDRGRGEVILLVEDETSVRELGRRALTSQGYRVLAVENGAAALELWRQYEKEVALLLTDLIMPGDISGLQLAQRLLAQKPGQRVIYTSGYSREIAGRELPMEDGLNYLAKPYELGRLYRIVRAALDGPPASSRSEPRG